MQIVLHLEKTALPARSEILAAAAQAVAAACLLGEAGLPGSPMEAALAGWYGLKIRKVARRASGAGWRRAQDVPGCTVTRASGAQARAIMPGRVAAVPQAISRLQIKGTDLPADAPGAVDGAWPLVAVDASLGMSAGKAAAQVGHGSMLLAAALPPEVAIAWARAGFLLAVREVPHEEFLALCAAPGAVVVADAGYTEVAPGAHTVVAVPGRGTADSN
ncbi:hypothetical protein C1Y63_09435 [Corynebacterium sp. 13CS0277]|nr:hypothetical protein C1Y63_09435 [Corynebacterium sp. 13CS0277]